LEYPEPFRGIEIDPLGILKPIISIAIGREAFKFVIFIATIT
jgi:hypothetical protein